MMMSVVYKLNSSQFSADKYLMVSQTAKASYTVFIVKSCIYGGFVAILLWKHHQVGGVAPTFPSRDGRDRCDIPSFLSVAEVKWKKQRLRPAQFLDETSHHMETKHRDTQLFLHLKKTAVGKNLLFQIKKLQKIYILLVFLNFFEQLFSLLREQFIV